jgi:hypothetical protein
VMARLRRPGLGLTRADLGRLLQRELPQPHPASDLDGWKYVMQRRYERAAELGFGELDVILCARDETLTRALGRSNHHAD